LQWGQRITLYVLRCSVGLGILWGNDVRRPHVHLF
jgi:hypothetical protein